MQFNIRFIKNNFSIKTYNINQQKIKYYSLENNIFFDKFCENYYYKTERNPYFINRWYSLNLFNQYLLNSISIIKSPVIELGAGLGLTSILLKKNGIDIQSMDYEYFSCLLIKLNSELNNLKLKIINSDWNKPVYKKKYNSIILTDTIYEKSTASSLFCFIQNTIKKNGKIFYANFKNYSSDLFINKMKTCFNTVVSLKEKLSEHIIEIYIFEKN